ncbi:Type VI secretion system lysozyme-like protein [Desulfonema limicola]|uniref:Type VI secretion system lysozyme-like protein n=1 Tax=Desulfonema limicola TaxID=45656 RepID=A0A975B9A5_9BACT|nr:type VI secretion system baseplate subunit TssE [Desulfonema limicola]QTA81202.1 Type VI secretion system lysozyme-like protein [Desulfonema limicola]
MNFFKKFNYRPEPVSPDPVLESIIQNLNNILNTRMGYGSPLADFGIRDMNEYTSRGHIANAVMDEVRRNIELYEPGVEILDISIDNDTNPFKLSFKIECRIKESARSMKMVFDTVMNSVHVDNL